ncbi:hypothetical protein GCM10011488_68450 [Steroidobacter agaridevorans]|nr:hypothetical protein GCM10011488_68450 [Steroidobacter agaridevorans]
MENTLRANPQNLREHYYRLTKKVPAAQERYAQPITQMMRRTRGAVANRLNKSTVQRASSG